VLSQRHGGKLIDHAPWHCHIKPHTQSVRQCEESLWAAGQDPCQALSLAVVKYLELSEGLTQLIWADSEWSGTDIDLALNRDRQQTPRREAFHHGLVESLVSKQVTEKEIHGRTLGKAIVEIDHVEAAMVGDAGE
jgi:hypothetical protein